MEREIDNKQIGQVIDREKLIDNLKIDEEFLKKPKDTQMLHFEAIGGYLDSLGALKDAKLNIKTLFEAKASYLDYLMNNGFANKVAEKLGWVLAFSEANKIGPERTIHQSLKLARDAAKLISGLFTVTNLFRMGEDKEKVAERFGFNPETTSLYKAGNLTVGGLLEKQPWIVMEADFIKKHIEKMEELSETKTWSRHRGSESEKIDVVRFSDHDREVLLRDGATIYQINKDSLNSLKTLKWRYSYIRPFFDIPENFHQISKCDARPMEVAIYTDKRFLIKESYNKSKDEKEKLLKEDAKRLKKVLGLRNIREILPEVPEAASVFYQNYLKNRDLVIFDPFKVMPDMDDGSSHYHIYLMLNTLVETSDKVAPLEGVPSVALATQYGGGVQFLDDYVVGGGTFAIRWIVPSKI